MTRGRKFDFEDDPPALIKAVVPQPKAEPREVRVPWWDWLDNSEDRFFIICKALEKGGFPISMWDWTDPERRGREATHPNFSKWQNTVLKKALKACGAESLTVREDWEKKETVFRWEPTKV